MKYSAKGYPCVAGRGVEYIWALVKNYIRRIEEVFFRAISEIVLTPKAVRGWELPPIWMKLGRVFHHSNWTALGWARSIWRTPIYIRPLSFIFIYMHSFNKIDLLQSACLRKNPEDETRMKLG